MSHIYFARSLRGDRTANDKETYRAIAAAIKACGHKLSMDLKPIPREADWEWDDFVYYRDLDWLNRSAAIVAEVTNVTQRAGIEFGRVGHREPSVPAGSLDVEIAFSAKHLGQNRTTLPLGFILSVDKPHFVFDPTVRCNIICLSAIVVVGFISLSRAATAAADSTASAWQRRHPAIPTCDKR